jgi:hypothetical protein
LKVDKVIMKFIYESKWTRIAWEKEKNDKKFYLLFIKYHTITENFMCEVKKAVKDTTQS